MKANLNEMSALCIEDIVTGEYIMFFCGNMHRKASAFGFENVVIKSMHVARLCGLNTIKTPFIHSFIHLFIKDITVWW